MDKTFENSTKEELTKIVLYLTEQLRVADKDREVVKVHLEETQKQAGRISSDLYSTKRKLNELKVKLKAKKLRK